MCVFPSTAELHGKIKDAIKNHKEGFRLSDCNNSLVLIDLCMINLCIKHDLGGRTLTGILLHELGHKIYCLSQHKILYGSTTYLIKYKGATVPVEEKDGMISDKIAKVASTIAIIMRGLFIAPDRSYIDSEHLSDSVAVNYGYGTEIYKTMNIFYQMTKNKTTSKFRVIKFFINRINECNSSKQRRDLVEEMLKKELNDNNNTKAEKKAIKDALNEIDKIKSEDCDIFSEKLLESLKLMSEDLKKIILDEGIESLTENINDIECYQNLLREENNNITNINFNTFLEELKEIDEKYEYDNSSLFNEEVLNDDIINIWKLYKESTLDLAKLRDEDCIICNEEFKLDIKKVLNKNRDPKKEEAKLNAKKKLIKDKYGINVDNIVNKFKDDINDIKGSIENLNFEDPKDYKIAEKILNTKFLNLFGKLIKSCGDAVNDIYMIGKINNKILASLLLVLITVGISFIFILLFTMIAGPIGNIVACCTVCPLIEEINKYIAAEYIDKNDKFSTYNTVFNIFEFIGYVIQVAKNPLISVKKIMILRIFPVIMHSVNTIIIRHTKEENRAKVVLFTLIIHCAFNAIISINDDKITKSILK